VFWRCRKSSAEDALPTSGKFACFAQNLQGYQESVSINAVGCRISYDWAMLIQLLQP